MRMTGQSEKNAEVKDRAAYAVAVELSQELSKKLEGYKQELKVLMSQSGRTNRMCQQYIARCCGVIMPDSDIDRIAAEVIRGQDMAAVFAARRKERADAYARVGVIINDDLDLELIKKIDDVQLAVSVFTTAVKLQGADLLREKQAVIRGIVESLRPRREEIARLVAKAVVDLRSALAKEQQFAADLAILESGVAKEICPAIFPMDVLAESRILAWEMQVHELGLVGTDLSGPRPN